MTHDDMDPEGWGSGTKWPESALARLANVIEAEEGP